MESNPFESVDPNPYESPTTTRSTRRVRSDDWARVPYTSARILGYVAVAALVMMAVMEILLVGSKAMQIELLGRMRLETANIDEVNANDLRERLLALTYLLVHLGCIVTFLMWIYRANRNLRPLEARGIEFTPGWAVGWWFVPFANLVRPYQVIKEVYLGSSPRSIEHRRSSRTSAPLTIRFWWGCWLVGNFAAWIGVNRGQTTIDGLISVSYFAAFSSAAHLVAAGLAIAIVLQIDQRQDGRNAMLEAGPAIEQDALA